MLVPYSHSPIVIACRTKSLARLAKDISLFVAGDLARVPIGSTFRRFAEEAFRSGQSDTVCSLMGAFFTDQRPVDANLINIKANGLVEAVNATSRDFHGEGRIADVRG